MIPIFRRVSKDHQRLAPPSNLDLQALLTELEQTIALEKEKNARLEAQLEVKSRKERELLALLRSYNEELHANPTRASGEGIKHLEKVRNMHEKLLTHISDMQSATGKEISKHENTLVRTFNSKLTEIKDELEGEKRRKVELLEQIEEREAKLQQELELMKASVVLVDQQNKQLYKENQRLRRAVKEQNEVEAQLHLKLQGVKKKASGLSSPLQQVRSLSMSKSQDIAIDTPALRSPLEPSVVLKLQHSLSREKRRTAKAKQELAAYLSTRTELETVIKECLLDVKQELKETPRNSMVPKTEREKLVKQLMQREQVLSLLYHRAFPPAHSMKWGTAPNSPSNSCLTIYSPCYASRLPFPVLIPQEPFEVNYEAHSSLGVH